MQGQLSLFEFLAENYESLPAGRVKIEGVVDSDTLSDFTVQSTYRDIFLIINMLDDYVGMLSEQGRENNFYTDYIIGQFARISKELAEQINLDKEKMYKRCQKKQSADGDVGEDAMVLASKSKKME